MSHASESKQDVLLRCERIAQRELKHNAPLRLSTDLAEELAPDSMSRLALVTALENEFRICIDDERAMHLQTMDDVVMLVMDLRAASQE